VSDSQNHRIQVWDLNHQFISCFGGKGSDETEFIGPCFLAIFDQNLYVTDYGNARIQVFSIPQGKFLRQWKVRGQCTGITISESQVFITTGSIYFPPARI